MVGRSSPQVSVLPQVDLVITRRQQHDHGVLHFGRDSAADFWDQHDNAQHGRGGLRHPSPDLLADGDLPAATTPLSDWTWRQG
jgi:hypothetical protein